MYNGMVYNLAPYNIVQPAVEFIWKGTVFANTDTGALIQIIRRLAGSAAAQALSNATQTRNLFFDTVGSAVSTDSGTVVRIRILASDAYAESGGAGGNVTTVTVLSITIPGVNMKTGDVLQINTDTMTVTLNGNNIAHLVSDDSEFFKISTGEGYVETSGIGNADIKILWKDMWV